MKSTVKFTPVKAPIMPIMFRTTEKISYSFIFLINRKNMAFNTMLDLEYLQSS